MFVLKLPVHIPPPRRADRTILPAALTALLGMVLVAQLAMPLPVDLPEVEGGRPLRLRPLAVPALAADPEIALRTLFAPTRRAARDDTASTPAAPLGGARAIGVAQVRGRSRIFIQAPDGSVRALFVGAAYDGWRLVAATGASVTFVRDGDSITVPLTASALPVQRPAPGEAAEPEEEPQ